MAVRGISPVNSDKVTHSFTTALASAFFEWLLIFMLFIDAIFSYSVTKFAHYCKLQVPCLLCSRLDHVLGNEKLRFYWNLICGNHKLEISSLVLCHVHNKLVDVHGMCENCLFSFATINKSNADTYRLLVGKLGADPHPGLDSDPLLEDHKLGDLSTSNCCCCNEPWILRRHGQTLLQSMSIGSEVAELYTPLSVATQRDCNNLKRSIEEQSGSNRASHGGKNGFDPLSHIEYTKVKVTSDTESEVPFSDDDDGSALIHETADLKEHVAVQSVQMEPRFITLADDLASEKLILRDSAPELSLLDSHVQVDVIGSHGSPSVTSTAAIGHGLEELTGSQVEPKPDASATSNFASFDVVPQSASITETPTDNSTMRLHTLGTVEVEQKCGEGISEVARKPVTRSEKNSEIYSITTSDTNTQMPNNLELGDAYKLAVSNKGRQLSGKLLEQRSSKESTRLSEDLKLLLSQISVARGVELPLNEMSPSLSGNGDELKTDSSGSLGMHILQRRISLERNESGLSLDGSIVSEIEGESEVDRLKRQVEHDKKLMGALYKELEEERNASAVAANQAMAMITRLQEEKAALHMEALQALRMMEEQAEYDVEALQKANNLLAEKEKEIQDLEADLESYKDTFGDVSILDNEVDSTGNLKAREVTTKHSDESLLRNSASDQGNSVADKPFVCNKVDATKNSLFELEDESLYIVQCLKKLEKKLRLFSDDGVYVDVASSEYSGAEQDRISDFKELYCKGGTEESAGKEERDFTIQTHASLSEESCCAQGGCDGKETSEFEGCRLSDVGSLRVAVSSLIGRLEALEHSFKSLKGGDEEHNVHSRNIFLPTKDCDIKE